MSTSDNSIYKRDHVRRCSVKSLLGPLPHCVFGPKAFSISESSKDESSLKFEYQKLVWSEIPESVLIIKRVGSGSDDAFMTISSWLVCEKKLQVYVEQNLLSDSSIKSISSFQEVYSQLKCFVCKSDGTTTMSSIDLIITIGGDGTLLYAASMFQCSMPPVLAFNCGSLGFLTAHNLSDYKETIELVLKGNALLMLRSRLTCHLQKKSSSRDKHEIASKNVGSSGGGEDSFLVLNEVVVNRGASRSLCQIDLFLEGRCITTVQGDGLIISTPSGSTAYAVAAGASMVHPDVPSVMITPICPHSLSFRPVVIPSGAQLKFAVSDDARDGACVSFDGRCSVEIDRGDSVYVSTSIYPAPCICKSNPFDDWFDSLSECLQWNSRQIQKKLSNRNNLSTSVKNAFPKTGL